MPSDGTEPQFSTHPEPPGERCYFAGCDRPATHKVGEEAPLTMHNLTTYLCCEHMHAIGLPCSAYPYELAMKDPLAGMRDAFEHLKERDA